MPLARGRCYFGERHWRVTAAASAQALLQGRNSGIHTGKLLPTGEGRAGPFPRATEVAREGQDGENGFSGRR